MLKAHAGSPERSKRSATARKAATLSTSHHAMPGVIGDSNEQFEDYNDDVLWDLADEAADDQLHQVVHTEILRRQNSHMRCKPFRVPVRAVLAFLLIAFVIVGPLVAMWLFD